MSVLYRLPNQSADKWKVFLQPFKWNVWLSVLSGVAVCSVVLWTLARLSKASGVKIHQFSELRFSVWFIAGAILQQGKKLSLKILLNRVSINKFIFIFLSYAISKLAALSQNLLNSV